MNIVRLSSRNVIFILLAILLTTVKQGSMGYDSMINYALKEANANSTPAHSSKKEETMRLCPSGTACSELSGECLKCNLNTSCIYGMVYIANCSILEHVDCVNIGNMTAIKKILVVQWHPLANIIELTVQ
ncbi:TM2 domain-containing protein 3 isoform X2 [Hylaeus volcanicus]|uniref:TM2 domain-containing protein 3 isoform X2 n=1 Tax=Hylaeus volcanicus TaxID=313075 RepID=UPI0023B7DA6B|nr:TM2 domain-containing protein 3 isoform X2 [Hylaeus volcanicus]